MYSPGAAMDPAVAMAVARDTRTELARLETLAGTATRAGVECATEVVEGQLIDSILKEAGRVDAGMIIMGSHGHGAFYELLVGSVTEGVLRRSDRPVLVVPAR